MRISKDFYVIALLDSQDNTWLGVVSDIEQDIFSVSGLVNRHGNNVAYAGKLDDGFLEWRETNNIRCSITKQEITAEIAV